MNPFLQQAPIQGVKKIIAVGSGKGGVGKSTVAVNLAVALKKQGLSVGLLDADIYGPSIPRLVGAAQMRPEVDEAQKRIQPILRHGLKVMSLGFLVEENLAVIWRGPMLFKAMDQLLREVNWGDLDVLVIDLPPGTGDVALTMAQKVPVDGAIVVCTPQNLALADAKKAVDMFSKINVPILGVVENMAELIGPNGEKISLFPRGELNAFLDAKQIRKLAAVPFYPDVGIASEAGVPVVDSHSGGPEAHSFMELAKAVSGMLFPY